MHAQSKRNMSQLPNFALSVPLALFNSSRSADAAESCQNGGSEDAVEGSAAQLAEEADVRLQDALLMFPNVLIPLTEKCQVTLDPVIMKHPYFGTWNLNR